MDQAGILVKLKEKYFRFLRENNCDPALTVKSHSLTPEEVWPIFFVAAVGLFIATVCIIAERMYTVPHTAWTVLASSKHSINEILCEQHAQSQFSIHMFSEWANPPSLPTTSPASCPDRPMIEWLKSVLHYWITPFVNSSIPHMDLTPCYPLLTHKLCRQHYSTSIDLFVRLAHTHTSRPEKYTVVLVTINVPWVLSDN